MIEKFLVALLFGIIVSETLLLIGCRPWFAVLMGFAWCAGTFLDAKTIREARRC